MRLIDFSARTIPPHLIKEAGYDGVVVYVSESRPGSNFGAKPVIREYADDLRAAGLEIVSNYQYGKPGGTAPSDFTRGFDGGVADATTALRLHGAAGGPDDAPIIFSVDDNVDLRIWNDVTVDWFRGINSVIGIERTGIYGHSRVCAWAIEDGVIGRSTTPGHYWIWQTKAWSQGEREPAAVLFQGVVDTPSNPGPLVGGSRVDVNEVLADDFGQWSRARARTRGREIAGRSVADHPDVTLVEGATGRHVTAVQQRLNVVTHAGLLVDGEFADLTRRAVAKFQRSRGRVADGEVDATTWKELFAASVAPRGSVTAAPVDEEVSHSFDTPRAGKGSRGRGVGVGGAVVAPRLDRRERGVARGPAPFRMVTGPGITSSVQMELTDLGIMRWDPDRNAIAAMFGDNFSFSWGQDWKSPSIVMYDNDFNVLGIPTSGNGIVENQNRRQLWSYNHVNGYFDTVLPCDFIKVNGWWYVAVMLSKGRLDVEGAQFVTEFWQSRDLVDWTFAGPKLEHVGGHPGNTMLTFDQIGDYVYIFGTGGLTRNKPVWMWRNKASEFPGGMWEPWGFDGFRWDWGIPNEGTPILQGWYAELCFRHVNGNCVLSYLEGGRMTARTVEFPEDNWQDGANVVDYVHDFEIQNLYGGFISPSSRLNEPNGMKFFVSQWVDTSNYRVYLVEGTLFARGPIRSAPPELRTRGTRDVAVVTEDHDAFPLPDGVYWGPLTGPEESWSNQAGTEPQSSIDGLTRWQQAIGVEASGVYDNATREAAAHMQYLLGWTPSLGSAVRGVVRVQEWDEVIRNGWRFPALAQPTDPPTVESPGGYEIGWYPGPGYNEGHGPYLRIYLHTTENQDWITKAEDVAAGQAARQDGSYHFLVDDYHVIKTVPTEHSAWGLQLDNPVSVQIAMVGTSGTVGCWQGPNPNAESAPKTREQWLAHDKMLDMVAYTIAVVATEYGIPIEWLDIDGVGANLHGVSSHNNYSYGSTALHGHKDTDHWDVPPTFPADVVLGAAKVYASTMAPNRAARSAPAVKRAPAKKAPAKKAARARKVLPAKKVAAKKAPARKVDSVKTVDSVKKVVKKAPVKKAAPAKAAKKTTPAEVAKKVTPAKAARKVTPRKQARKNQRG